MFSSFAVANEILSRVIVDGLRCQFLVFTANMWHLYYENTPLVNECFMRWDCGPVLPSLYGPYQHMKAGDKYRWGFTNPTRVITPRLPKKTRCIKIIENSLTVYNKYSTRQLQRFLKLPGFAWDLSQPGMVIENSFIMAQASRIIKNARL